MEQTSKKKTSKPYSPEFPERAVRLAMEHRDEYQSEAAALTAIAGKLGCSPDSLRVWMRQVQRDGGERQRGTASARPVAARPPVSQITAFAARTCSSLRKAVKLSGSSQSAGRCSLPLPPIMTGARMIIGVDLNNDKKARCEKFGMTHFVNPKEIEGSVVQAIVDLTKTPFDKIGGADYSFDCTGNVKVMRDALECTHRSWGQSIIIGVAPAGAVIETRPFQLVTGRAWKGTAFGGARGRTDVPTIVDWYMDGKIEIDSLITHILPLEDINKGFDLMHSGTSIRSVVVF
jgi:transposase-like protein